MQEKHKETGNCDNIRGDYTNLQLVYKAKMFMFAVISIATVVQTRNDFHSLVIGSCTYSIGIVFDFLVVLLTNNGPKIKKIKWSKVSFGLALTVFGGGLVLLFSSYEPQGYTELLLTWVIRICMVAVGLLGPYTELAFNRPNDD